MFGYVNVCADELKVREFKMFKAYYCGLCKRQGKLCGAASRLLLSYDFTVLALLLDATGEKSPEIRADRCALHPFKKRPVVKKSSALDYCAYMSTALAIYKAMDDLKDEGVGIKSAPALLKPLLKKIKKKYPDKLFRIEKCLERISDAEKKGEKNIDIPAGEFGKLMAELFAYDDKQERVLRELGYNIGRWIYVVDAIDDYGKDVEKGRYSPFSDEQEIKESEEALWYNLSAASAAYELLEIKRNKGVLDNIIYIGLKKATERVLEKRKNG